MLFRRFLYLSLIFLTYNYVLYAQVNEWWWSNPQPTGNNLNDAVIAGTSIMAFGDGGVFLYSPDGGVSGFEQYPDSLNGNRSIYEADFVSPDTGYLCGLSGLLMKTTDGGLTWTYLNSPLTSNYWYLDFIDADTGYVVSSDSKVLKTTDGGQSWSMNVLSATSTTLYKIYFVSPSTGYLGTGSSTLGRLLKTTDYGASWVPVTTFPSASTVRGIYFTDEMTGYVTTSLYEIIKTTDGGTSWSTQDFGTGTIYEIKFYDANNGAAAGANGVVFVTTDAGSNWTPVQAGFTAYSNMYGIALGNSYDKGTTDLLAVGQSGNMAISTNMGATWTKITKAATLYHLRRISMVNENTGYACGGNSSTISVIIKTTDGGSSWDTLNFSAGYNLYSQSWLNENTGFVARRGPDGIFKTTDGGQNFTQLNPGVISSTTYWYAMAFADTLTGYASTGGGDIAKTTDGGASWTYLADIHSTSAIYALSLLDAQTFFAAGSGGKVSKTTDGGATFTPINIPGTTTLYAAAFADANNGLVAGVSGYIYRTTDGGTTWSTYDIGTQILRDILYVTPSLVWISGDAIMLYSEDGGATWNVANRFHGQNTQYSMSLAGNYLYTAGEYGNILITPFNPVPVELTSFSASVSGNSVYLNWSTATETNNSGFEIQRSANKADWQVIGFVNGNGTTSEKQYYSYVDNDALSGTSYYRLKQMDYNGQFEYSDIVAVGSEQVYSFQLEQNFPNPFNPATLISYQLPFDGLVTIKIYDILGNEIQTLVNEHMLTGRHNVSFDGSKYASGIYICKIKAGQYTASIKMTLLK